MKVFVDTSGLFAFLVRSDSMHSTARSNFTYLSQKKAILYTSSFVLVETTALLQRRIGLDAIRDLHTKILPLIEIFWVNREFYANSIQRLLLQGQQDLSLVDCLSFELMEAYEINVAFGFDKHFTENGFMLVNSITSD